MDPGHRPHPTRTRHRYPGGEQLETRLVSLRDALRAARQGDFSIRLPTDGAEGTMGEVVYAFNALIEENAALVRELDRTYAGVVIEGRTGERAALPGAPGAWALAISTINGLVEKMA